MSLDFGSPAFQQGQPIPKQYTADGGNVSPPLKWGKPPAGTRSLALLCEDPDAPRGTFTHWLVFNLPSTSRTMNEGIPPLEALDDGAKQGTNDFGKVGYGGPAPPPGDPHHYHFKLVALDQDLDLKPAATKPQLMEAMKGHVLCETQLMGIYGR